MQQARELRLERGVGLRRLVLGGQLVDRGDERLGHVPSAELAEERSGCCAQAHFAPLRRSGPASARLQERAEGGDRIAGHERLADEHGVGAGRAVVRDVGGREHRRLGDLDGAGGDPLDEPAEQVAIEVERREVAGVDADQARADRRGTVHLLGGVRLDERRHAELERERVQPREALIARGAATMSSTRSAPAARASNTW